jgi:hypothetical protein
MKRYSSKNRVKLVWVAVIGALSLLQTTASAIAHPFIIDARRTDAGVLLFELMAARMKQTNGDCDALAAAAEDFRQENLSLFLEIGNREQAWDADKRKQVATRYRARVTRAAESLHAMMASCRFRGATSSPICEATGGGPITPPGDAQCGGCDCSCICPLSGWACTGSFFGCFFGGAASAPNCC